MNTSREKVIPLAPGAQPFRERVLQQWSDLSALLPELESDGSRGTVHRARVLSRRLRAGFSIIKNMVPSPPLKKIGKALRGLTRLLGPIRSLDVTLRLWETRLGALSLAETKLKPISKRIKKKRKRAGNRLKKDNHIFFLKGVPQGSLESLLQTLPWMHFSDQFHRRLGEASSTLEEAWAAFERKRNLTNLHELRISLKKWRYLVEIRSECFNPFPKSFFAKVKSFQDSLGAIHDLEVLKEEVSTRKCRKVLKKKAKPILKEMIRAMTHEIKEGTETFYRQGQIELAAIIIPRIH